jgi:hypothetical protein
MNQLRLAGPALEHLQSSRDIFTVHFTESALEAGVGSDMDGPR